MSPINWNYKTEGDQKEKRPWTLTRSENRSQCTQVTETAKRELTSEDAYLMHPQHSPLGDVMTIS
jgi:hypothetical protein